MNINTTPRDDNRALAFIAAANYLKSTIPAGVRGSVDVHDYTFYNYECPVTHVERDEDGQPIACFAVTREGEIVTLIKKPGASMPSTELMQLAINNGGRWLYCLDTSVLRDLYTSMAFIRVACTPWDSALARQIGMLTATANRVLLFMWTEIFSMRMQSGALES